jgi:lipoic acid synthetase
MTKADNDRPVRTQPRWAKIRATSHPVRDRVWGAIEGLHTVCQSANCPNVGECFAAGTATFLILGDVCTRDCRFCAVRSEGVRQVDPSEPRRLAEAAAQIGLQYVVVTSVTRDDLPDGGAAHFAECIREIRRAIPGAGVEVLVPDFAGSMAALETVLAECPTVLNHNIETVARLYPIVRPQAVYERSLALLRRVDEWRRGRDGGAWRPWRLGGSAGGRNGGGDGGAGLVTKSGMMVGLGESPDEVIAAMGDLIAVGCDVLTIGQYYKSSPDGLRPARRVPIEEFERYKRLGEDMGFARVVSGPLVRSSYHAEAVLHPEESRTPTPPYPPPERGRVSVRGGRGAIPDA